MATATRKGDRAQNAWEMAQSQLETVAGMLRLDPGLHEVLRHPMRELTVNFPVKITIPIPMGLEKRFKFS